MLSVFSIVFPVFSLIMLGFGAARWQVFSTAAQKGLSDFAFKLAIPALLFRKMATVDLSHAVPADLLLSYFSALAVIWVLATLLTLLVLGRSAEDSASIAMGAGFGNVVLLGIPLALGKFGDAALAPLAVIVSIHAPILWFTATFHLAMAGRNIADGSAKLFSKLIFDLAQNPIIVALITGSLWRLTGIGLAQPVDRMLEILGQASVASALVALGLSLNNIKIAGQAGTLCVILGLKMFLLPALVWLLAVKIFALPHVSAGVAVLLAACPPGVNVFLFATRTERAVNSASGAIALGTPLAAITMTLLLYFLDYIG